MFRRRRSAGASWLCIRLSDGLATMAICASCSGRGTVTCFSCGGRRFISRLTASGDMDMNACGVCAGKGTIRCQFCGGSGKVGADPQQGGPPPLPRARAAGEDALAGRWNGQQGTGYEFVKRSNSYEVIEFGPLGRTGAGSAKLSSNIARLDIDNVLFGHYSIDLKLEGDTLKGTLMVMGIPMPMVLNRG